MNSESVIRMIYRGKDLKYIKENFKYTIVLKCGEEFSFYKLKVIRKDKKQVEIKIGFSKDGLFIPRDRRIRMKSDTDKVIPRNLVLLRSMILYHNIPELEMNFKPQPKRKSKPKKMDRFEIIGILSQKLGRMPTDDEITNYKQDVIKC